MPFWVVINRQHYRAEHYFVHVVQVFSKMRNIFIFIEWSTFCHSAAHLGVRSKTRISNGKLAVVGIGS